MAELSVFSIRDVKADTFGGILCSPSKAAFRRSLTDMLQQISNEMMCKFPSDFDVYYLGEFDMEKGVIHTVEPEMLYCLDSLVDSSLSSPHGKPNSRS